MGETHQDSIKFYL